MPKDERSATERLYDEVGAKHLAEQMAKLPKPQPKPETCPYCGSAELETHRIPLERTATETFCLNCYKSWDKE